MAIVVTCQQCKREFVPTRMDFVTKLWRVCPKCRSKEVNDD